MAKSDSKRRAAPSAEPADVGRKSGAPRGALGAMREWMDAIIIAYILAMFIRTFAVELFKIPSGSMTPTLIGDVVAEMDLNNNGQRDLLVLKEMSGNRGMFQVYLRNGKELAYDGRREFRGPQLEAVRPLLRTRYDRILVNKFAYWFRPPDRGDLVVFKVPLNIWSPEKPIYIKRAVAFEGERVGLEAADGGANPGDRRRLTINGAVVEEPPIFRQLRYSNLIDEPQDGGYFPPAENDYIPADSGFSRRWIWTGSRTPEDHFLALGDNTEYSSDGRFWGAVPTENLKGKAFVRYWPLRRISFLR